ncbi:glycosyl transferase family 2 [Panacagrimonas perspica]|nr:glycosyl transferase family 2 [Panacagrimonas perspica]
MYVPVRWKLVLALVFGFAWFSLSVWIALPWIAGIAAIMGRPLAWVLVTGVALLPGLANSFLLAGLLLDRRPVFAAVAVLPPITVLVAAYNEEACIEDTLASLARQKYDSAVHILVIDDGSTDATRARVQRYVEARDYPEHFAVELIGMPQNGGKARALNAGLARAAHDLVLTVDADTTLFRDALANLVVNQLQSPPNTAATAGTVLVRNSRVNFITRLQEWDYFLGIAVVKRIQSLFQGTLVAQGAFSIYRKEALLAQGGWQETVGEDIVLTWAMLEDGYRVGYAENAFVFTNVPETYGAYYRQRKRWSRGVIEAFKRYPRILANPRMNLPFVYLNLAFPFLDLAYLFVFVPGVIAALVFQSYLIVGVLTLLLIPLAAFVNALMFLKQRAIFRRYGLRVRRNLLGVVFFTLLYQLILSPASLVGYASELFNRRKSW